MAAGQPYIPSHNQMVNQATVLLDDKDNSVVVANAALGAVMWLSPTLNCNGILNACELPAVSSHASPNRTCFEASRSSTFFPIKRSTEFPLNARI
jgi:hypothetical protein